MKRARRQLEAVLTVAMAGFWLASCSEAGCLRDFTEEEIATIMSAGTEGCLSGENAEDCTMRVLTINDSLDTSVLRSPSSALSPDDLCSRHFRILSERMLRTVTHPSQDGVGIAAPQVGINRKVIAVQRFDKPGEPFEVYANIRILSKSDSTAIGREGCLSVPGMYAYTERSQEIVIEYADIDALSSAAEHNCKGLVRNIGKLFGQRAAVPMVTDTVRGFTAVIFQHEADHLDGILYTDRAMASKGMQENGY